MAKEEKGGFAGIAKLIDEVQSTVQETIEETISEEVPKLKKLVADAEKAIKENRPMKVEYNQKVNEVKGLRHVNLDKLILVASQKQPVLLVGMAGTGKTHAAEQVAEALGLEHYTMSVGAQTSKSDIIGYMHASGGYVPTMFRKAYEEGGVFLMDEIDAGNANVLIQVNAALSNGLCAFPDKMVKKHKDFIFIASANTFGNGANPQYVGRNQLDAATLDRFTTIVWNVDEKLEFDMVTNYKFGTAWLDVVRKLRNKANADQMRVLITPRATVKGAQLLELKMEFEEVLDMVILESVPADKRSVLNDLAKASWNPPKRKYTKKSDGEPETAEADEPSPKAEEPVEAEIVW